MELELWNRAEQRGRRLAIERPPTMLNVLAGKVAVLCAGAAIAAALVLAVALFDESGGLRLSLRPSGTLPLVERTGGETVAQPLATATRAASSTRRVGNTAGEGVYLRRTPRPDDRLRLLAEDATVVVLGPRVEAGGWTWLKVQDTNGDEGWLPEQYLLP